MARVTVTVPVPAARREAMVACETDVLRCSAALQFLVVGLCCFLRTTDVTGVYELLLDLYGSAVELPGESGPDALLRLQSALALVTGWTNRCANAETPLVLMNLVGVTATTADGGAAPAACRIRGCGAPRAADARWGLFFTVCGAHLPEPVRTLVEGGLESTRYEIREGRIRAALADAARTHPRDPEAERRTAADRLRALEAAARPADDDRIRRFVRRDWAAWDDDLMKKRREWTPTLERDAVNVAHYETGLADLEQEERVLRTMLQGLGDDHADVLLGDFLAQRLRSVPGERLLYTDALEGVRRRMLAAGRDTLERRSLAAQLVLTREMADLNPTRATRRDALHRAIEAWRAHQLAPPALEDVRVPNHPAALARLEQTLRDERQRLVDSRAALLPSVRGCVERLGEIDALVLDGRSSMELQRERRVREAELAGWDAATLDTQRYLVWRRFARRLARVAPARREAERRRLQRLVDAPPPDPQTAAERDRLEDAVAALWTGFGSVATQDP